MAYLSESQREQLLNELIEKNFNQAKGKLRRMDPQGRMVLFRNVQRQNEWTTRYELPNRGVIVTLIESRDNFGDDPNNRHHPDFELARVIVEPTAENRT